MQDFKIIGREMNRLLEELKKVQENMESSYRQVEILYQKIEGEESWKGKNKETFLAYFGLMKEYHKSFTDSNGENPIKQAEDSLKELEEHVEAFYMDFSEYKKVEGLR